MVGPRTGKMSLKGHTIYWGKSDYSLPVFKKALPYNIFFCSIIVICCTNNYILENVLVSPYLCLTAALTLKVQLTDFVPVVDHVCCHFMKQAQFS